MQIAVISPDFGIGRYLNAAGFTVMDLRPDDVPSLTALLFDYPEISGLVIQDSSTAPWSISHVLTAAKHLQRTGPTVLFGAGKLYEQCYDIPLVLTTQRKEEIPCILRRPLPASGGQQLPKVRKPTATQLPPLEMEEKPRPLNIPPGKLLMLGVIGSQSRIGCTTQAIGLWHYCKQLGFDPAIVVPSDQLTQLTTVMDCQSIQEGYLIEGIPFVTSTALAYDCYVLDIGAGSIQEGKKMADCLVLVAGSKPWELPNTAASIRATHGKGVHVLLSYTTDKDMKNLQPLFGGLSCAAAPYTPNLWLCSTEAMLIYDKLLRSTLERLIGMDRTQEEKETEQSQGGT